MRTQRAEGLLGDLAGLPVAARRRQRRGETAEHPRPLDRRRLSRDQGDGRPIFVDGHLGLARGPEEERELRSHHPCSSRLGLFVHGGEHFSGQLDREAALTVAIGGLRGAVEEGRAVHSRECLRLGDAIPEVDGAPEVAQRVGVGVDGRRRVGGLDGRPERLGEVVGREPVVGELGGRSPALSCAGSVPCGGFGEPVGDGVVQASPLAGQQVGVDDLREQRMAETVGPGPVVHLEHVAGDRLADRLDQLAFRQSPVTVVRSSSSAREPATATAPRMR